MKINQLLTEKDIKLSRGKVTILKAEGDDYDRGLRVKLLEDGGYEIEYWYKTSSKGMPVEVVVDGKSVKKDAKKVKMLFHPELDKD